MFHYSLFSDTKYNKPRRMCPFCDISVCKLKRHITAVHKEEDEVKKALSLPLKDQDRVFASFRNRGIKNRNMTEAGKDKPQYESLKKCSGAVVHCQNCDGCYSKTFFYRHKQNCQQDSSVRPRYIVPNLLKVACISKEDNEFKQMLSSLQSDDVGKLCMEDDCIMSIGRKLFYKDKSKVDKSIEVRKSVRGTMRILARLLEAFQQKIGHKAKGEEMFNRKNFEFLSQAVREITVREEDEIKYGLKHNLYYTLVSSAEILRGISLETETNMEKSKEYEYFLTVLKMNQNLLFGDCKYQINKARQERLRLPSRTPEEKDITCLRAYMLEIIAELSSVYKQIDKHTFVDLRNAVCSRLTLFNARRGNEPCRMKVSQWINRNQWFTADASDKLSEIDRQLFASLDVMYMTGKGNHLVPCLVP